MRQALTYHPRTEADDCSVLGFRVDMSCIKAMLNIALLGVKVCLVNPRFSQVADGEKRGNKSGMGCKVEQELLPKG